MKFKKLGMETFEVEVVVIILSSICYLPYVLSALLFHLLYRSDHRLISFNNLSIVHI